ncbi:MAG: hypothetical protein AAGJ84_08355 [Pseudomonadota bacterium]
MSGAVIQSSEIVAAHDGVAELVVTLKFENGGESLVTLDEYAARWLLEHSNCEHPEALRGQSWELVRDALAASSSRYVNA